MNSQGISHIRRTTFQTDGTQVLAEVNHRMRQINTTKSVLVITETILFYYLIYNAIQKMCLITLTSVGQRTQSKSNFSEYTWCLREYSCWMLQTD